jgi:hypothetical protein
MDAVSEPSDREEVDCPPPPTAPSTYRRKAQSKFHMLDHADYNPQCPGCNAKARNKKHYRGAFQRDDERYANVVTMDQVGLTDVEGTLGIGKYRYAIVLCKIDKDYWSFMPLKTLEAGEADIAFRQFCTGVTEDIATLVVYCDAHTSLIRFCDNYSLSRRHPPPARPQANSVIERKIGFALSGLRAYLVSGGLPNCFWPFAGHSFAIGVLQTCSDHLNAGEDR